MSSDLIDINKLNMHDSAEVERVANFIIAYDMMKEAYLLYTKNAQQNTKSAKDDALMAKLKWVGLPKLKNDEVVELFSKHFTDIFKIDGYDVWDKLKQNIIFNVLYEERDGFKEKIKKALLKNEEKLTEKKIVINGKEHSATVANWMKDYNVAVGIKPVDLEKQSRYLTNSSNMKNLVAGATHEKRETEHEKREMGEKDKLKTLFKLYEKLKLSSLTAAGFEEGLFIDEDGVKGYLEEGIFTKFDPKIAKRIAMLQRIIGGEKVEKVREGGEGGEGDFRLKGEEGKEGAYSSPPYGGGDTEGVRKIAPPPANTAGRPNPPPIRRAGLLREEGGEDKAKPVSADRVSPKALASFAEVATEAEAVAQSYDKAKRAYIFSMEEQELIKNEEEDIKRMAKGNIIVVGKELTKALEDKNRLRTIAALRLAVKNNLLIGWSVKHGGREGDEGKPPPCQGGKQGGLK